MNVSITAGLGAFSLSLSLAALAYIYIERPILNLSISKTQLLFYCSILCLLINRSPPLLKDFVYKPGPMSPEINRIFHVLHDLDKPLSKPYNWTLADYFYLSLRLYTDRIEPYLNCSHNSLYSEKVLLHKSKWCETIREDSTRNLTAIILGNSHAARSSPIIHANKIFRRVIRISDSGCHFPKEDRPYGYENCKNIVPFSFEIVEKVKPDIVFIFMGYLGRMLEPVKMNVKDDWAFRALNETVTKISKFTKAIILTHEDLKFGPEIIPEFVRRRVHRLDIDFMKYPRSEVIKSEKSTEERLNLILKYCEKCTIIRPADAFCDEKLCDPIDRNLNLPMFADQHHIRILGQRKYQGVVDKIVDEVVKKIA
ncbi:hypothetical protein FO519_001212 [Halicephalobus sp. NKZ332]|nr:hypothetical protein FO519_001212 [Halicephalobus sp. NKZ332]